MLALTIREKNGEERQLIFEKEEVTIGRATGSDIVLPRNNISKRHARLVDKHDKVVIVDLRSTNGTYVNGRRITAPELLTYEDKVYIGDFVIRLSRPAEQHPSQKMTTPYSASPTPAEPRSARAATAAVDPHLPPPLDESDFMNEEPLPARPAARPPEPPDEDESTRAIAAMPDDDDFPPPPRVKAEPPKPPTAPPKPRAPSAPTPPIAPPTPVLQAPKPPAPRAARPPSEEPATMTIAPPAPRSAPVAPSPTPVVKKAPPPEPVEVEDAGTSELDSAQSWSEGDYDPWAEWNAAVETVVAKIEADHPGAFDDAPTLAASAVDEAITSGAIAAETDRAALIEDIVIELTQGGPLAELFADPTVHLVAMNGPKSIHVARAPAPSPLEPNGRVFATIRSYRRALAELSGRDEDVIADLVGLDEHRLADGSVLKFIGSGTSTPHAVWQRGATDVPLLPDLVADGVLDQAQAHTITQAALSRSHIAVVGQATAGRAAVASAIAAEFGLDRRVVVIGDGTRVALAQTDVARVASSALMSGSHLAALEADLLVFERLDVGTGSDWTEAGLLGGASILTLLDGSTSDKALKRLGLAVELATGLEGRGAAIVGECIDLVVTVVTTAEGAVKVEKIQEVESQKDGFSLKAPVRR